jgi:hypothetical protein
MKSLTFIDYLQLSEDVAEELSRLTAQRAQLVVRKTNATKQIDTQIANLDKVIANLEKQRAQEVS